MELRQKREATFWQDIRDHVRIRILILPLILIVNLCTAFDADGLAPPVQNEDQWSESGLVEFMIITRLWYAFWVTLCKRIRRF